MSVELKLITSPTPEERVNALDPQVQLRHLRHLTDSMLSDALSVWADITGEFDGVVNTGNLIEDRAKDGFTPRCGWPEFMEKMRTLEHYLAHTQRIARGD